MKNLRIEYLNSSTKLSVLIPLNEIWISEMWRSYEKGLNLKSAHEKAIEDQLKRWKDYAEKTAKKKGKLST